MPKPLPDQAAPAKPKPPSFWLTWLIIFLVFLPVDFWARSLSSVAHPSFPPCPPVIFSLYFALHSTVTLYMLYHISRLRRGPQKTAQIEEQTRIAALKSPSRMSLYQGLGMISAFIGVTSCASHLECGHPSVAQVILFTLGFPLYYCLLYRLGSAVNGWIKRRALRRKTLTDAVVAPVLMSPIQTKDPVLTAPTQWRVATEESEQVSILQGR